MTIKKPWKAEYWPQIIEEVRLNAKRLKDENNRYNPTWPHVYDPSRILGEKIGLAQSSQYIYIQDSRIMQKIVDMWHELNDYSKSNLRRNMKSYENKHLLLAIYKKRKEEFNALVAENDS